MFAPLPWGGKLLRKDPQAFSPLQSSLRTGHLKEKAEVWQYRQSLSSPLPPPAISSIPEFLWSYMVGRVGCGRNPGRFSIGAQSWSPSTGQHQCDNGEDLAFRTAWGLASMVGLFLGLGFLSQMAEAGLPIIQPVRGFSRQPLAGSLVLEPSLNMWGLRVREVLPIGELIR